jgi:hypothetical protein
MRRRAWEDLPAWQRKRLIEFLRNYAEEEEAVSSSARPNERELYMADAETARAAIVKLRRKPAPDREAKR